MEPSWTEPPPFAGVFIGGGERSVCRREICVVALSGLERRGSIIHRCEEEHVAQGRALVRSDKGERWTGDDHSKSSGEGGARSAGTGPTRRNVPVPH